MWLIKQPSANVSKFTMPPFFYLRSLVITLSIITFSSKWSGTLLPLLWIGLKWWLKMREFSNWWAFPIKPKFSIKKCLNSLRIVISYMFDLQLSGCETLLTGWRHCFWAISIPSLGKLSFPKMFLSCLDVINNDVLFKIQSLVFCLWR